MSLQDEQKRWEDETLKPVTDRFPERKPEFKTLSGIPLSQGGPTPHRSGR